MQTTLLTELDVDLEEIEEAVGTTSFSRGKTYARAGRVRATTWDEDDMVLSGSVIGNGAVYDTYASFERAGDALEFDEGECSCPVGWNCKHVAALVISVLPTSGSSTRKAKKSTKAQPAAPQPAATQPASTQAQPAQATPPTPPAPPAWELPLRAMIVTPAETSTGEPLAIELTLAYTSSTYTAAAPRLKARLMRPGARGGWINGSLSWGSLEPWNFRGASYREDHLELAREFHSVHRTRQAVNSSRYYYSSYSDREKSLDLTDWDAAQLWSLLDRASTLGLLTIHSGPRLGEVPRYRTAELVLDVTATPDGGRRVDAALSTERPRDLDGYAPLMFLGSTGHGLVMIDVSTPPSPSQNQAKAKSKDPGIDITGRPMRLMRLVRETPAQLQRMLIDAEPLTIPAEDLTRFATELAPALNQVVPIFSSDGSFTLPEIQAPQLVLRADHAGEHLTSLAWTWLYTVGDEQAEFTLNANPAAPGLRNLEAEREILDNLDLREAALLTQVGLLDGDGRPARSEAWLGGFDTVRFITETLPALEQLHTEVEALNVQVSGDPMDYRPVDDSLQIGVSTREIDGDQDWFDLNISITVDGRELPFALVFAAIARGEQQMLLDDGAYFSLLAPELDQLRQLIEEARALADGTRPDSLRISRYQAGLWEELVALGIVREQAESWQRQIEAQRGLDQLTEFDPPPALQADLRPYQLEGFRWLATLWNLGLGGILADDMGLGKTVQTLALISHALENPQGLTTDAGPLAGAASRPFLVIAPTSVVPNWVHEARRFTPDLKVCAMTDTLTRAGVSIGEVAGGADLVVTTYTLARLDEDAYCGVDWAGVILDEAQAVKNHAAKTHATVRRLRSPFKLAISGTPMENNLAELWALLSITAPGLFPDPKAFDEHYGRPIERHGDAERLALLRRRIRPLVKRRTKELVAADLPAKQEQILEVELHPRHRKLYDTHMQRERRRILGLLDDFDANRFSVLTAITKMRQLSLHAGLVDEKNLKVPSAKLDALAEQLIDVAAGGHRALVFSQFTSFLSLVKDRLDAEGIGHCYLDGKTRNRDKVLTRFKEGDDPVFLVSLKSGGFGLNLTEADYCFLLDPWWNPAIEAQAIDRTHRIGQTRQVMVYRLVSAETIEQKVVALAARKAALFKGVMDDGDLFAGQITAEDIRGLLG